MKEIPLTQGKVALVDDEDYEWLSQFNWYAQPLPVKMYARKVIRVSGKKRTIGMHRFILGLEYGDKRKVDHIDRNPLNNQRSNLRLATALQNAANRGLSIANTSGYKGVDWNPKTKKWQSKIKHEQKTIWLGEFENIKDAACAYDVEAIKLFGDYAYTNFPKQDVADAN